MPEALTPISSWRQRLARSLHLSRSKPHARFVQMASVSHTGKVTNRTLVYRGFVDETDVLIMITDSRSEKYKGLSLHPQVELCWYFEKTREQYRISGSVNLLASSTPDTELRSRVWYGLSAAAQEQFYWYLSDDSVSELIETGEIPDTFCVLLLEPNSIDYLYLGEKHQRTISQLSHNKWQEKPINP